MRWTRYVAPTGKDRQVYKVLVEKTEGKRPLGRPRHRWEDGITMDQIQIQILERVAEGCGVDI
jgi:hypothetical protein